MKVLTVTGGDTLTGSVEFGGAKNSMQFAIAAALLGTGPSVIVNVPKIADIAVLIEIIEKCGGEATYNPCERAIMINPVFDSGRELIVSAALGSRLRSTILLVPPLVGKAGSVWIPIPGGDRLGLRPIDVHRYVFEAMGGNCTQKDGGLQFTAKGLKGCEITLPFPSFTGTGFAVMLAAHATGMTLLHNVALEPELDDLYALLGKMGAEITNLGERSLRIQPATSLSEATQRISPDRLEVGTYIVITAATRGRIEVAASELALVPHIHRLLALCGAQFTDVSDRVIVDSGGLSLPSEYALVTGPFPAFSTDLGPQVAALFATLDTDFWLHESLHSRRFGYISQLRLLGAECQVFGRTLKIRGGRQLTGANVVGRDIRGTAALLIAALCAEGVSTLSGIEHLDRGYELWMDKLQGLGADIKNAE